MRNFRLDDESGHQEALFSWAAYRTEIMPELQYMYHVPKWTYDIHMDIKMRCKERFE